ncbi:MAG: hypothetical protein Fur0041_21430 [Bacteroidia bacterium]
MSNFKFHINPEIPDQKKIDRHKDFGKVMRNYKRMTHPLYRTPLYRYRKVFMVLLLVLLVAWLVSEYGEHHNEPSKKIQDTILQQSDTGAQPAKPEHKQETTVLPEVMK